MSCARSRWKGAQWAACNKRAMGAVSMDPFLRTMRLCPRSPMGLSAQILDEWFSEVACFRTAFYPVSHPVTLVHISRLVIDIYTCIYIISMAEIWISTNCISCRIPVILKKKTARLLKTRRLLWAALGTIGDRQHFARSQRVIH